VKKAKEENSFEMENCVTNISPEMNLFPVSKDEQSLTITSSENTAKLINEGK
jgi:hypothetical protein